MIKGARKQMIVVRTGDSRYFDEAYFVLRKELKEQRQDQSDLLQEANRLLNEHTAETRKKIQDRLPRWILFSAGILCGALAACLICLLLL